MDLRTRARFHARRQHASKGGGVDVDRWDEKAFTLIDPQKLVGGASTPADPYRTSHSLAACTRTSSSL